MAGHSLARSSRPRSAGRRLACLLWALAVLCSWAPAQNEPQPPAENLSQDASEKTDTAQGYLIRVSLPITSSTQRRVEQMVERAMGRFDDGGPRPVLIFELAPGASEFGEGSQFPPALALARLLSGRRLAQVKTVAYVPRSIKGHAVLVAMACEEIVMAPDAEIGEAGADLPPEESVEPVVLSGYKQIASDRRTFPVPVALGLVDKNLEVLKVETEINREFVLREDLKALEKRRTIQSTEVLIRRGEPGRFTGREARELGFVKYLSADRQSVARALGLPASAMEEDPSLGGDWHPVRIELSGPIDARLVGTALSIIKKELEIGETNFILLQIDSTGGSLEDSFNLATFLAEIDPGQVRTVAYVPSEARAAAAVVSLACDQLVMSPTATLGGAPAAPLDERTIALAKEMIRDSLAKKKQRSWSLIAAMIDPNLVVYRYTHQRSGEVQYFSQEEVDEQDAPDDWQQGEQVTTDAQVLEVDGRRAAELSLAFSVVENLEDLKQHYGLEGDPRLVEPGWADFLIQALANPGVATLLLVLGGVALYAELQMPGIGIGGFVASVAFLLFFWSRYLDGTADWLEITLFLGGVCFVLLEVFVIPGFGVFGLGGGLMIIVSLVLASQTFVLPRTAADLLQLRSSVFMVGGAGVGIIGAVVMMRRYLPNAPLFNRLMLNPLDEDELARQTTRETIADFQHLLGSRGKTITQLTPGGKARFGEDLVDVIADGEVIDPGQSIEVVEVHGNRVIVREVPS